MNESDRFAQADQQVSILKDRIAPQREAVKQAKLRGHAVALAEGIRETPPASLCEARSEATVRLTRGALAGR
jgi:hypothetical protein